MIPARPWPATWSTSTASAVTPPAGWPTTRAWSGWSASTTWTTPNTPIPSSATATPAHGDQPARRPGEHARRSGCCWGCSCRSPPQSPTQPPHQPPPHQLATPSWANLPVGAAAGGPVESPTGVPVPPPRTTLPQLLWCRLAAPYRLPARPRLTAPATHATPITPGGGGGEFGRRWAQRRRAAGRPGRAAHRPRPDPVPAAARASGPHHPPAHRPRLPQPQRRRASPGHPAPARGPGPVPPPPHPRQRPLPLRPRPPRRRPAGRPDTTRSPPSSATAATGPWPWPTPSGWRICWASTASSVPSPAPPARIQRRRWRCGGPSSAAPPSGAGWSTPTATAAGANTRAGSTSSWSTTAAAKPPGRLAAKLPGYLALAQASEIATPLLLWLPTPAREAAARHALAGSSLPVATATPTPTTPRPGRCGCRCTPAADGAGWPSSPAHGDRPRGRRRPRATASRARPTTGHHPRLGRRRPGTDACRPVAGCIAIELPPPSRPVGDQDAGSALRSHSRRECC